MHPLAPHHPLPLTLPLTLPLPLPLPLTLTLPGVEQVSGRLKSVLVEAILPLPFWVAVIWGR
jgi:hypothetical protein